MEGPDITGQSISKKYLFNVLKGFIEYISMMNEYSDPLRSRTFIEIIGYASSGEMQGDAEKQKLLAYRRARYIYRYLVENNHISPHAVLVRCAEKGSDPTMKGRVPDSSKRQCVEIKYRKINE